MLMPRLPTRLWMLTVGVVLTAVVMLSASVWVKVHTVDDPAWIGLGVAGTCLLLLAIGVHALPRR